MREWTSPLSGARIRANSTAGIEFAERFMDIEREAITRNEAWAEYLKGLGIIAAHPNDGWVDREGLTFILAYPLFQARPLSVGDRVALGWPPGELYKPWEGYMIVEVTKIVQMMLGKMQYSYKIPSSEKVEKRDEGTQ